MLLQFVDDSATNLKIYATVAAQIEGTESRSFTSSLAALASCERDEPDLIVLDYRMPAPNGIEFIERFRGMYPRSDTPIVMVTSENDRDVRYRALASGASDFLNKPVDPVEFLTRIKNLLALRERGKRLAERAESLDRKVRLATKEIADREHETIARLTRAMEYRDNDTGLHVTRMGNYAMTLGRALALPEADVEMLLIATPMHDIGKVATPDHILLKPGPLDADEWQVMKQHAAAGHGILVGSASKALQLAAEIALSHHERWDGTGYPNGLAGTAIPLAARICAVGDVFDALISRRPYKAAWPAEKAFQAIARETGSHFDPAIVEALFECRNEIEDIMHRFADAAVAP